MNALGWRLSNAAILDLGTPDSCNALILDSTQMWGLTIRTREKRLTVAIVISSDWKKSLKKLKDGMIWFSKLRFKMTGQEAMILTTSGLEAPLE